MPNCEMCGAQADTLETIKIEGATLDVCSNCSDLGVRVNAPEEENEEEETETAEERPANEQPGINIEFGDQSYPQQSGQTQKAELQVAELVFDYDERIKRAREQAGRTQADVADAINEKESLISRLENGKSLPDEDVRRKLERELDIELVAPGGK